MLESKIQRTEIFFWALVALVCASVLWFALHIYNLKPRNGQHYTLVFDNAVGLKPDSPVSVAGVDIGSIDEVKLVNNLAHVDIVLNPEAKIYPGAKAEIRARSLLGEKYVALHPGPSSPKTLDNGAIIANNPSPIDVDQVVLEVGSLMAKVNKWSKDFRPSQLLALKSQVEGLLGKMDKMTDKGLALLDNPTLAEDIQTARESFVTGREVLNKINKLLDKADAIDEAAIRDMLQIDGIKVRLWASPKAKKVWKRSR